MTKAIFMFITLSMFFPFLCFSDNHEKNYKETKLDLSCKNCNVVFLNIDLLRADFVGLLNSSIGHTPNIDTFFKNSIIFNNVSSSSGVTAISNTATLTSRYGDFTYGLLKRTYKDKPPQMPHHHLDLYLKTPTIAETLKSNGYTTININHGWYAGKQMLLNRGIDIYFGSGEVDAVDNVPAKVIRKTTEILKEFSEKSEPFFLLMRSEDLRGLPYRYPIDRLRFENPKVEYRQIAQENYDIYFQPLQDGTLSVKFPSNPKINWMTNEQVEEYQHLSYLLYKQQLEFVDEELGKMFHILSDSKLKKNTIIVLYSNHGDGLYDNRVPNHGVSYQSCVSVPVLIKHPKIESPVLLEDYISLIDLVPTIEEMVAVNSPKNIDGISLVSLIKGLKTYPNTYIFGTDKESKYIRKGEYKLIVWSDRVKELFNLKKDPKEKINLIHEYPAIANELYQNLLKHEIEQLNKVVNMTGKDMQPIND